jgi:UDP-N-acetylglucosamine--N-acetylmuramyl-(pentapeptide) pyrophosphoryl-undecaprenol N-acetylglucosamine transferase
MADLQKKIVIACGGTGGHLFPGVAVAQELKARGHDVRLLISEKKVDAAASKKYEDLQFEKVEAIAKPSTFSLKMIPFLFKFWKTTRYCYSLLKKVEADAVLGMGGFTSMPPVIAGKRLGLKCFVHDSNALPGKANRLTARYCDAVLLGMASAKSYFPKSAVEVTGTPVRKEIKQLPDRQWAAEKFGLDAQKKTILVMGGSQGAKRLNSIVVETSKAMPDVQFIHLTGSFDYQRVKEELGDGENHKLIEFCDDMPAVFALSDLAVSRSGASSMTELAYVGLPSILIPYPYAADDHQSYNAGEFVEHGAAVMFQESELDAGTLVAEISEIFEGGEKLKQMQLACDTVCVRDAATKICEAIERSFSK